MTKMAPGLRDCDGGSTGITTANANGGSLSLKFWREKLRLMQGWVRAIRAFGEGRGGEGIVAEGCGAEGGSSRSRVRTTAVPLAVVAAPAAEAFGAATNATDDTLVTSLPLMDKIVPFRMPALSQYRPGIVDTNAKVNKTIAYTRLGGSH